MIEWSDAAIEAALSAYWDKDWSGACQDANAVHRVNAMRVALDAAAQAQGILDTITQAIEHGRILGRAEAFEEAARIATVHYAAGVERHAIAAAIRDLAKKGS